MGANAPIRECAAIRHGGGHRAGKTSAMKETQGRMSACVDDSWSNKYYLYDLSVYVPGQRAILENFVTDPTRWTLRSMREEPSLPNLNDRDTQPIRLEESRSPALAT